MGRSITVVVIALICLSLFACSANRNTQAGTYRFITPEEESVYGHYTRSGYREIFAFGDTIGNTYLVHVKPRENDPKITRTFIPVKIGSIYTLSLATSNKPVKIKPDMELFGRIDDQWWIDPSGNLNWPGLRVVNGKVYGAYISPDLVNIEGVLYIRSECTEHE